MGGCRRCRTLARCSTRHSGCGVTGPASSRARRRAAAQRRRGVGDTVRPARAAAPARPVGRRCAGRLAADRGGDAPGPGGRRGPGQVRRGGRRLRRAPDRVRPRRGAGRPRPRRGAVTADGTPHRPAVCRPAAAPAGTAHAESAGRSRCGWRSASCAPAVAAEGGRPATGGRAGSRRGGPGAAGCVGRGRDLGVVAGTVGMLAGVLTWLLAIAGRALWRRRSQLPHRPPPLFRGPAAADPSAGRRVTERTCAAGSGGGA